MPHPPRVRRTAAGLAAARRGVSVVRRARVVRGQCQAVEQPVGRRPRLPHAPCQACERVVVAGAAIQQRRGERREPAQQSDAAAAAAEQAQQPLDAMSQGTAAQLEQHAFEAGALVTIRSGQRPSASPARRRCVIHGHGLHLPAKGTRARPRAFGAPAAHRGTRARSAPSRLASGERLRRP
jgi:hypothetical protein